MGKNKKRPSPQSLTALVAYNKGRAANWGSVDWTLNNREIALKLGRSYDTVAKKRVAMGKSGLAQSRATRKDKGVHKVTHLPPPEQQVLAVAAAKASPKSGRFTSNVHAKTWQITDPHGTVYTCQNLYDWVRANSHLFAPADVVWQKNGKTVGEWCRASSGLQLAARTHKTWKKWRAEVILGSPNDKKDKK